MYDQTDRKTDRQKDRQSDRQTDRRPWAAAYPHRLLHRSQAVGQVPFLEHLLERLVAHRPHCHRSLQQTNAPGNKKSRLALVWLCDTIYDTVGPLALVGSCNSVCVVFRQLRALVEGKQKKTKIIIPEKIGRTAQISGFTQLKRGK